MAEFSQGDLTMLREDIGELKTAFKDVAKALERLARLEERHVSARGEIDRSFMEQEKLCTRMVLLEQRVAVVETEMPGLRRQSTWVDKAVYGLVGLVLVFILRKNGLL